MHQEGGESGSGPGGSLSINVRQDKYTVTTSTVYLQANLCLYQHSCTVGGESSAITQFGEGWQRNKPQMDVAVRVITRHSLVILCPMNGSWTCLLQGESKFWMKCHSGLGIIFPSS